LIGNTVDVDVDDHDAMECRDGDVKIF